MNDFRHLDPTTVKVYQSTVMYSFETRNVCLMIKVRGGYVVETPDVLHYRWIRGQSLQDLAEFFVAITPIKFILTCF